MTREQAKQNLIALGIEEPTDAQVTNYLNQFHYNEPKPQNPPQQTQREPEPQPQSTEPDVDELEKLRGQIAQLQSDNIRKDIRAYAAEKGINGEQAEAILASYSDDLDKAKASIDAIANIITERETAAANRKEQEIANHAGNPGGGNAGGNGNDKPIDVANAESIKFGTVADNAMSARNYYK